MTEIALLRKRERREARRKEIRLQRRRARWQEAQGARRRRPEPAPPVVEVIEQEQVKRMSAMAKVRNTFAAVHGTVRRIFGR